MGSAAAKPTVPQAEARNSSLASMTATRSRGHPAPRAAPALRARLPGSRPRSLGLRAHVAAAASRLARRSFICSTICVRLVLPGKRRGIRSMPARCTRLRPLRVRPCARRMNARGSRPAGRRRRPSPQRRLQKYDCCASPHPHPIDRGLRRQDHRGAHSAECGAGRASRDGGRRSHAQPGSGPDLAPPRPPRREAVRAPRVDPGLLLIALIVLPPTLAVFGLSLYRIELAKDDVVRFIGLNNYTVATARGPARSSTRSRGPCSSRPSPLPSPCRSPW